MYFSRIFSTVPRILFFFYRTPLAAPSVAGFKIALLCSVKTAFLRNCSAVYFFRSSILQFRKYFLNVSTNMVASCFVENLPVAPCETKNAIRSLQDM